MTDALADMVAEVPRDIEVWRPGLLAYDAALSWQHARLRAVRDLGAPEALALLQHPPVFTLGMRGGEEHVLASSELIERRGAQLVRTDRGGDVTFHGPGQLVAYPILDVRARGLRPATYVRMLEAVLIETLARFGIDAVRVVGRPGVWVGGAKVAALGVRIRDGVSMHGVALNVTTDLEWFDLIVPCGLADASATSMQRLLGEAPAFEAVEDAFAAAFAATFDVTLAPSPALEVVR